MCKGREEERSDGDRTQGGMSDRKSNRSCPIGYGGQESDLGAIVILARPARANGAPEF